MVKNTLRLFKLIYVLTVLAYIFFGWVELQGASVGTERFLLRQLAGPLLILEPVVLVYLLRRMKPFDQIWKALFVIICTTSAILIWGYIRDRVLNRGKKY